MHKFTKRALGAVGAAIVLMGSSGAEAQVTSDFTANLDATDPSFANVFFNSGQPCVLSSSAGVRYYETKQISVTNAGVYALRDLFTDFDAGIGIYSGAFDPAYPGNNCVASSEDQATVSLAAGTYTLVLSSLSPGELGRVMYRFTGPAAVTLAATAAPVPTMSEWAMILLGTVLAGGAALYIQRRQTA